MDYRLLVRQESFYQAVLTTHTENRNKCVNTTSRSICKKSSHRKTIVNLHQILLPLSVLPEGKGHCSAKGRSMLLAMGHSLDPAKLLVIPSVPSK